MGEKHMAISFSAGAALVVAATACAAGALLPPVFAAIIAGVLAVAGLAAFSLQRADHTVAAIFAEERSRTREERPKKTA
jgi:membrane protein implicated in regulation of membrane protease activity